LSHEDRDINICPLQIKNLRMELRDPESWDLLGGQPLCCPWLLTLGLQCTRILNIYQI
jgi:hypothetical protein